MFGSIQGAYTDSIKDRTGFFEQADGGSILLDEIAELSLPVQAKLLRVLQDGFLQKVGESFQTKVDVRIIAATNVDLKNVMREIQISQGSVLQAGRVVCWRFPP